MANDNFTIQTFIENRWADTKIVLEKIDPTFVHTIEAYKSLENILELPRRSINFSQLSVRGLQNAPSRMSSTCSHLRRRLLPILAERPPAIHGVWFLEAQSNMHET